MHVKAQSTGNLQSTPQQVVKTEVIENRNVVVIEQANPEVVYVPSFNPVVVYGPPVYPYPPIYYPPYGAYAAGAAISFGAGVAMGAAWGGGWGWNAGWGHNDINVNYNNNFNRNANINRNAAVGNRWQHQPAHRGGTPYQDRATANRYGGTARGDAMANRQAAARQTVGTSGVAGQAGAAARDRASQAGAAARDRAGAYSSSRAAGVGGDRIGQRDVSRGSVGRDSAFGGGS